MWELGVAMLGPVLVAVVLTAAFITWEYCAKRWWRRQFRGRYWNAQPPNQRPNQRWRSRWNRLLGEDRFPTTKEGRPTEREPEGFVSLAGYFGRRAGWYGFAILTVGLALLVRWLLEPVLKGAVPYSFFLAATVITAWNAGVGETLLAVVLGFLAGTWFFVEPFHSLNIGSVDDRWSAGLYLFIGLAIVTFKKSMQIAWLRALNKDIESLERRKRLDREEAVFEEARLTHALLANVVETAEAAILTVAPSGVILTWNRAAEQLLGFSAHEAIGQRLTLIIPLENRTQEQRILQQIAGGERRDHWRTALGHKHGGSVGVMLSLSPVKDQAGKLVGAVIIASPPSAAA